MKVQGYRQLATYAVVVHLAVCAFAVAFMSASDTDDMLSLAGLGPVDAIAYWVLYQQKLMCWILLAFDLVALGAVHSPAGRWRNSLWSLYLIGVPVVALMQVLLGLYAYLHGDIATTAATYVAPGADIVVAVVLRTVLLFLPAPLVAWVGWRVARLEAGGLGLGAPSMKT